MLNTSPFFCQARPSRVGRRGFGVPWWFASVADYQARGPEGSGSIEAPGLVEKLHSETAY